LSFRRAFCSVVVECPHLSQVDDDSAVRKSVICSAVATAANRQLQSGFASEIHDAGHIVRLRHPRYKRWPPIEIAEERRPRTVVVAITGHDYSSLDVRLKVRIFSSCHTGLVDVGKLIGQSH
jgi:hypothetical protein